ncbi:PhnD/SsuA/transferrin family substrate-binding protein [Rhodopseudomonas palustris]|uniref:histidine kinase n=1 Tax=Thiospirillum jenense TaxID=1653858 RepID=A0A839HED4_9GAMM|nr:PhnD/SsuA/transferrin family substrate-binding protein [Thiospirillum jenense]MBB1089702.1 PhnD/SsuA/transferrin family substrate-binding protein [Rhodopseudomonas palustris]MBB1124802.1 PhnD/SsuA/transferrin family substrate-binding protein [Thiospirillum jenense]
MPYNRIIGVMLLLSVSRVAEMPSVALAAVPLPVTIGVLTHRNTAATLARWQPTADYLSTTLPQYYFCIMPLSFNAVEATVTSGNLDLLLVNPSLYVMLSTRYRVSRIATLRTRRQQFTTIAHDQFGREPGLSRFASVIFTRAVADTPQNLAELRGRKISAVAALSLGGFQIAQAVLQQHDIELKNDTHITFTGSHDAVVTAVLSGQADVGIVRTGILERFAADKLLDLQHIRILGQQFHSNFPLLHSSPLYPEWPFSILTNTDATLAQQVAIALLKMPPDSAAAIASDNAGWTVPLDYQPVQELLQTLQLPPYQPSSNSLANIIIQHWLSVLIATMILIIMATLTGWVFRLNYQLNRAKIQLEQRQQFILDAVAEGIFGVDLTGRITFANRAIEKLTNWSAVDLIGAEEHALLHHTQTNGEPFRIEYCPICATLRDHKARFIEEDIFWCSDGCWVSIEYSAAPLRDDRAQVIGAVIVVRDITHRRALAERLRQLEIEHSHITRLTTLGEMVSSIGHEINQPLTAIATNARACLRLINTNQADITICQDVLTRIAEQSERAAEVIRQMRRLGCKQETQAAPIAVAALFDTVRVLLGQDARRADVTLQFDVTPITTMVLAQEIQIAQVLLNLTRNALEAMNETPNKRRVILLRAAIRSEQPDQIELRVADTGPGLARGVAQHLFEPFVTTKPNGLGLGLSISSRIIEAHGSSLQVETTPGIGTTFSFTLPRVFNTTIPLVSSTAIDTNDSGAKERL